MKSVYTDKYSYFLKLVIAAGKTSGLTQRELAGELNKPQSYVSKYERGERRLDVIEFLDIANILAINTCTLFKRLQTVSREQDQSE